MKINLNGNFEENRRKLNEALGIDHEEQTKQIKLVTNPKELKWLRLNEDGTITEITKTDED